jgi:hypothetical protein
LKRLLVSRTCEKEKLQFMAVGGNVFVDLRLRILGCDTIIFLLLGTKRAVITSASVCKVLLP